MRTQTETIQTFGPSFPTEIPPASSPRSSLDRRPSSYPAPAGVRKGDRKSPPDPFLICSVTPGIAPPRRRASSYSLATASNGSSRLPPVRGRYVPPGRRAGLPAGDSARTQAGIGLILLVVGFRGVLVLLTQGREESPVRLPFAFIGAPLLFQFPASVPRWLATGGRNPSRISFGSLPGPCSSPSANRVVPEQGRWRRIGIGTASPAAPAYPVLPRSICSDRGL